MPTPGRELPHPSSSTSMPTPTFVLQVYNKPWLNLRPAPTGNPDEVLRRDAIMYLYDGDVVQLLGDAPQCVAGYTWYHVRFVSRADGSPAVEGNPDGWIAVQIHQNVTLKGVQNLVDSCCHLDVSAAGPDLNLRADSDLFAPIVKSGLPSTLYSLTVVGQRPGWWLVSIDYIGRTAVNMSAWVSAEAVPPALGNCAGVPWR